MDTQDEQPDQLEKLAQVFRDQLLACLEECAHGRRGLFVAREHLAHDPELSWPDAERLRELAAALLAVYAQSGESNSLCDEFLDLCTIHGEHDPGESRLARAFLARIEKNDVGTPTRKEQKPW